MTPQQKELLTIAAKVIFVGGPLVFALFSLRRIPFSYIVGNMKARRISMLMSILGIGVVIAVMLSMKALDHGVELATQSSGSKDNLMVMREGAEAEISSWVTKDATQIIRTLPGIARDSHGEPLVSPEITIIFKLPRPGAPKGANVIVRGVSPAAFEIRPYVKIVEGRMFRPGSNELIVSKRIRDRYSNLRVGDTFTFGPQAWTVSGTFDANDTAFDSEIWSDLTYLGQARKRTDAYSSVLVKTTDEKSFDAIKSAIKNDNRLKLQARSEYQYYADQMNGLIGIKILVSIVTFFMVLGAILGTMNTMFSSIAPRQRELATMRALGFKRRTIIGAVILESAIVALLGGLAGWLLSLPINGMSTGTVNWSTFSEVAFSFKVDLVVVKSGMFIALAAGIYGGALPAIRSARKPIVNALREI
jgi:ABC-type lipoprotein release transport system permease subunit